MGKQRQKKKTSRRRMNPIQRKGIEAGVSQASSTIPTPEQVIPVVDRLSCDNPTERAWAAACISNLVISNAQTRKILLTKGIVPTLIQRLGDNQQEVRDESLGALRNLVSVDNTIAKEYYSRNIMEPLSMLLPQIANTINSIVQKEPIQDEADQNRRTTIWDVAENFIYIIWCISEASDKYIKAINRMNLVSFLTSFLLNNGHCPSRVVIAAGQCLTTLTDDNKDLYIEFENHPEYTQSLLSIVKNENENILVQVLACAILTNVRDVVRLSTSWDDEGDTASELNKILVPVLMKALDYDIQEAAAHTITAVQSGRMHLHKETSDITPKPKQPLTNEEIFVQGVEDKLSIIQLALELLADICVQDDESEEDGYQDEAMMDDDDGEPKEQEDEEDEEDEEENTGLFADKPVVDEAFIQANPVLHAYIYQIFPHLIRLSTTTPISYQQTSLAPTVSQNIVLTHQRTLECLNNFLLAMNDIPGKYWFKTHRTDAVQLWRWLFTIADQVANSNPEEWARNAILEAVIGCLWALGRGLEQDIPLEPTDVGALCGTYEMIPLETMRVKIVGCLGPIAMRKNDIETNKVIGVFVMKLLSEKKYSSPAVIVEALNLVYDVYSDCAFDYDYPVFIQGDFLNALRQAVSSVRSMVKAIDRRRDFDLRMRADEALENLNAFIKYKKSEQNRRK
ncbi:armadillo-type protein [Gilbertella persicaria]|uniref:armadillo-type protein n=1 Tax=Gilbertella persicaria TaxID=101096 RepID=UPI002220429B|nr:armadillo-type protein [Gilbertella persicaria]KAI8085753.1 armadillo-type protein [Gilbertella persicaria]